MENHNGLPEETERINSDNIDQYHVTAVGELPKRKKHKSVVILVIVIILSLLFLTFIFRNNIRELLNDIFSDISDKPIIYLYPEEETDITVTLGKPEELIVSYPLYQNGWSVHAYPDGTLKDNKTGKSLYALYYESEIRNRDEILIDGKYDLENITDAPGFIVKGEDTANFLEEKLEILGLTPRESEEFIVYWLPRMCKNKYNYIRFLSSEEIESIMPLSIYPVPDTAIRVYMVYKGVDSLFEVEEQVLDPKDRSGYTTVEWGGTELKH